ncbi:hypothetical protein E4U21_003461 [Claviceps maximensis]|nr:hypothetical protein E4U21_003461 [Claviceps maximensis]
MESQNMHPKAGLTNILNNDEQPATNSHPPPHLRDSGFFSTTEMSSKHTSGASFNVNGLSPAGSGYQSSLADKTPSPVPTNIIPQSLISPSASNMSVASMVSPASPINDRRFDRPLSTESQMHSGATLGENLAAGGPRRESVDSRINQGIGELRLGNSPYASSNHSTTSVQNTLHAQRNPRCGLEPPPVHRISNSYHPSAERNPVEPKIVKTAPAITGPATSHIARAAEPTKGQAWAFPEEEIQRVGPPGSHYDDSRRSSISESIASSQFTTESRLPPGQRRLEDGADFARMSNMSTEFPPVHHHTMHHKQLSDLQAEEANGPPGSQPYSRTPELRVSHKLAERKRRTEMKELFDQLRDLMPQERGSKASKWEILTKAIAEHQRQSDHIRLLQSHCNTAVAENEMLRRELQNMRMETAQLRGELNSTGHAQSQPGPPPPPLASSMSSAAPPQSQNSQSKLTPYGNDPYAGSNRNELPPLRSIHPVTESMTGVQYDNVRNIGYRPERY